LDYLDESGLSKNTLLIYTSDQGFFLGDHGWYDRRFMYEESLRMPLIARLPGFIPARTLNNDLVTNLDFAPTFIELAETEIPKNLQGVYLVRILINKNEQSWRDSIYYHFYEYPWVHMVKRHYGIRTNQYKLIHFYYDIDAWQLYDLKKDPHELNNIYDNPDYKEAQDYLHSQLKYLQRYYGDSDSLAQKFIQEDLEKQKDLKKY
jgi:arylsulfatase A-like enzyme